MPATTGGCLPGRQTEAAAGRAIDIGMTSNVVYLVDLASGKVVAEAVDLQRQIAAARMSFPASSMPAERQAWRASVTRHADAQPAAGRRVANACAQTGDIYRATVAGNSTMIHLFLGLPPDSIPAGAFITTANQPPSPGVLELATSARRRRSTACPVASYVGSDIRPASSVQGLDEEDKLTLFLDVGTNGEMPLARASGCSPACSAGPGLRGAGVETIMRHRPAPSRKSGSQ